MRINNSLTETARTAIENALGYRFQNRAILTQAFTRASYCNEAKQIGFAVESNEVPEFFGDSILYAVVADYLFEKYITVDARGMHAEKGEGELTLEKISLTDKSYLSHRIRTLGLDRYLLITVGENAQAVTDSMAEDLFEALACAVWVDSGRDFALTREAIRRMLDPQGVSLNPTLDAAAGRAAAAVAGKSPKNELQEWCDKNRLAFAYRQIKQEGPDHDPTFTVRLTVSFPETVGVAHSIKAAEAQAAQAMLNRIPDAPGTNSTKGAVAAWCDMTDCTFVYRLIKQEGPDHDPTFTLGLSVVLAQTEASAKNRRAAETAAAAEMLAVYRQTVEDLLTEDDDSVFLEEEEEKAARKPARVELKELCEKYGIGFSISDPEKEGPEHAPIYTATVTVEGLGAVGGTGANKKDAKEDAARRAMELLAGTEEADWDETERKRRLEGALSALYLKKAFPDDEL